jgi:DNA polymerase I-like protein with 3'-5' exonuclease and polymerase domains
MLLKVDAKALEWRSYVELSRDTIGLEEIINNEDVHTNNQNRFELPSRLISKVFLFRWIYRGSAWAYANDNDFKDTSSDPNYWQDVINKANDKYNILIAYQDNLIWRAERREVITLPSGREFLFDVSYDQNNNPYWDTKKIVNYINQGYGADIMMTGRVMLMNRMSKYKSSDVKLMNTVHDDYQLDVANDPVLLYNICIELENIFKDIPKQFTKYFKKEFITPLAGEVSFGHNLYELTTFERTKGESQFL